MSPDRRARGNWVRRSAASRGRRVRQDMSKAPRGIHLDVDLDARCPLVHVPEHMGLDAVDAAACAGGLFVPLAVGVKLDPRKRGDVCGRRQCERLRFIRRCLRHAPIPVPRTAALPWASVRERHPNGRSTMRWEHGKLFLMVVLIVLGVVFGVTGSLLLYGTLRSRGRLDWWVRSVALLTGEAMLVVGATFVAAAVTSGNTRTDLLIVGALAGVGGAMGRWLVRTRWPGPASGKNA